MENKECVIIPLKEYNALKERIKELEGDHPDIDIEWGYIHERYGYFYSNRGKLTLSEGSVSYTHLTLPTNREV